jgi:hypothetical protein
MFSDPDHPVEVRPFCMEIVKTFFILDNEEDQQESRKADSQPCDIDDGVALAQGKVSQGGYDVIL